MTITTNSIISQVNHLSISDAKKNPRQPNSSSCLPDVIELSLRGVSITITRDTLLSLPECILMVMFPQGFITSQNDICHVNFDHQALTYILDQFQLFKKEQYFNGNKEKAITYHSTVAMPLDPFHDKQGMIVLREELEYFIVAIAEKPTLTCLKNECTQAMIKQDQIFDSLMESTAHKETSELLTDATNVQAEHQLIDLLCQAGFTKQDRWAHRWMESNKMYISSISVVAIQYRNRLFVGQKLMMFWRKPARKCWWSKSVMEINGEPVKLWSRRTWTLEYILL